MAGDERDVGQERERRLLELAAMLRDIADDPVRHDLEPEECDGLLSAAALLRSHEPRGAPALPEGWRTRYRGKSGAWTPWFWHEGPELPRFVRELMPEGVEQEIVPLYRAAQPQAPKPDAIDRERLTALIYESWDLSLRPTWDEVRSSKLGVKFYAVADAVLRYVRPDAPKKGGQE